MDPGLFELLEGDPEEEVAALIRLREAEAVPEGVRIVSRFGNVATCRLKRSAILGTRAAEDVASFKAPRFLAAEVEPDLGPDLEFDETTPPNDDRRPPGLSETGRGVVIGVVDWGIDFRHKDFLAPDGTTRLLAIWDQRGGARPDSPQPYGYGAVHTAEAINRALISDDPYAALGYHPADADIDGSGTHGTHVGSIAAGNGGGGGPAGIAPEAALVFVHMDTSGTAAPANLGDSVTLPEAVDFIFRTAGDRPCVINLSLGRHWGSHDGTSLVEQALDAALTSAPGRFVSQSGGNYYQRRIHAAGQMRPGEVRALAWEADEADVTANELEVWYSHRDRFGVEVEAPDGTRSRRVVLGERDAVRAGGRVICRVYHRAHEPNNQDHHINIFIYPHGPAGSWTVRLFGDDVVDGRYHAWIERDAACRGCQSTFTPRDADPSSTTGSICNGLRTVATGAYNGHRAGRPLAPFSSSGPTRDGRVKPDLVAPGVAVLAARSAGREGETPPLTRKSGTSMAAPHVAGTVACMFEAAGRPLPIETTRRLLLENADTTGRTADNAERIGSGYLDIERAVRAARAFRDSDDQAPVIVPALAAGLTREADRETEPAGVAGRRGGEEPVYRPSPEALPSYSDWKRTATHVGPTSQTGAEGRWETELHNWGNEVLPASPYDGAAAEYAAAADDAGPGAEDLDAAQAAEIARLPSLAGGGRVEAESMDESDLPEPGLRSEEEIEDIETETGDQDFGCGIVLRNDETEEETPDASRPVEAEMAVIAGEWQPPGAAPAYDSARQVDYWGEAGAPWSRGPTLVDIAGELLAASPPAGSNRRLLEALTGESAAEAFGPEGLGRLPSPARLFEIILSARDSSEAALQQLFEVVALPGAALGTDLQPGDLLVRRSPGEPDGGHVAMVAGPELWTDEELNAAGLRGEGRGRGLYARVIEGGPFAAGNAQARARLVADAAGRVPANQMVLRPAGPEAAGIDTAAFETLPGGRVPDLSVPCPDPPAAVLDRFSTDASLLRPEHREAIAGIARRVAASRQEAAQVHLICVEGHTDSTGADAYNLALGTRRAEAVARELRLALDRESPGLSRLVAVRTLSQGERSPVAPDTTPEGRARNRRVAIYLNDRSLPSGPPEPSGTTVRLSAGETDEAETIFAEQDSAREFVVAVGGARNFVAIGSPTPVGRPAYTWTTSDPAAVSLTVAGNDTQAHPNRVSVRGVRPGRARVTATYRDSRGRTASDTVTIIVVAVSFHALRDPAGAPVAPPALNELDRPLTMATRQNGVASRTVEARFQPADFFNGRSARWTFTPSGRVRGALPAAHPANLEAATGFSFTPAAGTSVINAAGAVAVRLNMPLVSFNKGRLEVASVDHPAAKADADFEVPGIVVIDPGHGGAVDLPGSDANHAVSVSNVDEKDMTLDFGRRVRDALQANTDHLLRVHMTRNADVNVSGAGRANVARDNGADIFLSIHMNGWTNPATRGTVAIVRANTNGNVNRAEDAATARRVLDATLGAIPNSRDRGVRDDTATPSGSLAVLNDNSQGNTAAFHPIRSCLLEVEFITNAAVDALFNTGADHDAARQAVADAIAGALVDDLANQPP